MWTYIQELSGDPQDLIASALEDKTLAPRKNPTTDNVATVVFKTIKARSIDTVYNELHPLVINMVTEYVMQNGVFTTVPEEQRSDYSAGLDDMAELLLEPYQAHISADWYGKMTIDTRLYENSEVLDKWTKAASSEVYKEMTYGKTPDQVLSNAGVTHIMMQEALNNRNLGEEETMTISTLTDVAKQIALTVGKQYDIMTLDAEITLAQNEDTATANGAGARIGLDASATMVLQMGFIEHGHALTDELVKLVDAALAAEKPKTKRKPAAKKDGTPPADAVDTRVMEAIKTHSSAKDNDVAQDVLGVSRGTWNSYVKGKAHFVPEGEQINKLRALIIHDVNPLLEALALLDGTTPHVVQ